MKGGGEGMGGGSVEGGVGEGEGREWGGGGGWGGGEGGGGGEREDGPLADLSPTLSHSPVSRSGSVSVYSLTGCTQVVAQRSSRCVCVVCVCVCVNMSSQIAQRATSLCILQGQIKHKAQTPVKLNTPCFNTHTHIPGHISLTHTHTHTHTRSVLLWLKERVVPFKEGIY